MRPWEGSRGSKDPALWKTVKTPLLAEAKARMHEALGKVPEVVNMLLLAIFPGKLGQKLGQLARNVLHGARPGSV